MKNNVYKLLLPMLLVTSFGVIKAGELSVKPIAPQSTSLDIIVLYNLADTLKGLGFEKLAISTRDTAKILGDSFLYWTVKLGALLGLLYQTNEEFNKHPDNKTLSYASGQITLLTSYFTAFLGNWGKPYTYSFKPAYDFAQ